MCLFEKGLLFWICRLSFIQNSARSSGKLTPSIMHLPAANHRYLEEKEADLQEEDEEGGATTAQSYNLHENQLENKTWDKKKRLKSKNILIKPKSLQSPTGGRRSVSPFRLQQNNSRGWEQARRSLAQPCPRPLSAPTFPCIFKGEE